MALFLSDTFKHFIYFICMVAFEMPSKLLFNEQVRL